MYTLCITAAFLTKAIMLKQKSLGSWYPKTNSLTKVMLVHYTWLYACNFDNRKAETF